MALKKEELAAGILQLLEQMFLYNGSWQDARIKFSNELADLIDEFVRSGEVIVNKNIPVATTGNAVAQSGFTTEEGNGFIQ